MPYCKNNQKRQYKGDEPSPKGLGYCASGEKEGTKMKGKDGNMWVIKSLDSGSKRWVKVNNKLEFDCSNFVIYNNPLLPGLLIDNKFYLWKSYNNFENKPTKIPENATKKRLTKTEIKKYCGPEKVNKTITHPGFTLHFISFAGKYDIPFIVYIGKEKNKQTAYVYKINKKDKDTYNLEDYMDIYSKKREKTTIIKWRKSIVKRYTEFVGKYHFINKFITDDAILLQFDKNKYLLIWQNIIEFEIEDTIKEFYAVVPGSYAFPISFGEKYFYQMWEGNIKQFPLEKLPKLNTKKEREDAYKIRISEPSKKVKQRIIKNI